MTFRFIRRNVLYSLTIILLVGAGIGASTVIFTAIEAFLLRPLPVARPGQLARLGVEASATHVTFDHSSAYARVLAELGRSFDSVFTFFPLDTAFIAGRHTETVTCEMVSDN
ncbi:MAG TPA: hypothetical protein VFL57_13535, partial [Bryobacteraceae bacterium]|nr:hypothetical protein [Bryobacteraceae bacterium]